MLFDEDNLDQFLDHVTESWTCPMCADKGVTAHVKLYQGDDEHAIYFCETPECIYPVTDDADPVIANRSLLDCSVDAETLQGIGLPASMLDEGDLTVNNAYEILLVVDTYKLFDEWVRLEQDMKSLKDQIAEEAKHSRSWGQIQLSPKCTPLNRLRFLPDELVKFVKHVIPNIEEIVELLRMDVL